MSGDFPPIAELLPQAGPMRLLDRVLAHDAEHTRCAALPAQSSLFRDAAGRIPVWVGIEYMAQCAAADGGLRLRARGEKPRPGLFVGSRRLVFRCAAFGPAQRLVVTARRVTGARRPTLESADAQLQGREAAAQRGEAERSVGSRGGIAGERRRAPARNGDRLAFDCAILDPDAGAALAEGRLNIVLLGGPKAPEGFTR